MSARGRIAVVLAGTAVVAASVLVVWARSTGDAPPSEDFAATQTDSTTAPRSTAEPTAVPTETSALAASEIDDTTNVTPTPTLAPTPTPVATATPSPPPCSPTLLADVFSEALRRNFPEQRFTAYVVDTRSSCVYELEPGLQITTASVLKVQILGGVLLEAQEQGRALTDNERTNIDAMMHLSLNDETGALWVQLGRVAGMTELDVVFGVGETTQVHPFGATWSTAADRTEIVLAVLDGQGPLGEQAVLQAWEIMTGVHRTQQWGISAGVAEGYVVAHKNGFYPMRGYGWRVGSSGFVADPDGGGYAITIMTDNSDNQADGVALVEVIAAHVSGELTVGEIAHRAVDDVICTTHTGGGSWTSLTLGLGLAAEDWNEVRLAAGGDGPLIGQSVCTP